MAIAERSASGKTTEAGWSDNADKAKDASSMVGGDAPTKSMMAFTWDFTIPAQASVHPMVGCAAFKKAMTALTL